MATWIALFRGINVGGKNIIKMADLKKDLESLKFKNVRTYIQSGNVVFESSSKSPDALSLKISKLAESKYGFRPSVMILTADQLRNALKSNPFSKLVTEPKLLSFFFLAQPSTAPDLKSIKAIKLASEQYKLTNEVFYLHAPEGFARSKLAAKVEKHLGVVATARNLRTVEKLMAMVDDG